MGRKCSGGFLDGMAVFTDEDVHQCIDGGGTVVPDGATPVCAASSVAAMSASEHAAHDGARPDGLEPFRLLRAKAGEHPLIKALLSLNTLAAPEIARIANSDSAIRANLVSALRDLRVMAANITGRQPTDTVYDKQTHDRMAALGKWLAASTNDSALRLSIDRALALAEPFVGKTFGDIASEILEKPTPHTPPRPPETQVVTMMYPSAAIVAGGSYGRFPLRYSDAISANLNPSLAEVRRQAAAEKTIDAKAHSLGWVGDPAGDLEIVPGGYRRSYANADIYTGATGQAFEVHGDIRAKYNLLQGPAGPLGLPVTDETGTPDGIGRYNHFEHGGSIYWTPSTGAMMVRGVIRNLWASQGWETGPLGYPVADYYRLPGTFPPRDNPDLAWSIFQNGAVFSKGNAVARAMAAEIQPDALKGLIRTFFDRRLHEANDDLGLEARVDLVAVSDWSYLFGLTLPRTITYRLYGFYSTPIIADTTFEIEIRLRFATAWPMSLGYPAEMSLIVALDWLRVQATGVSVLPDLFAQLIYNGINAAFHRGGPDPVHPEVPDGARFLATFPTNVSQSGLGNLDVINVLVTKQGGLQVLVNPLPPSFGGFRREMAQSQIDAFVQGF